ncbi:hypothetical protein D047_1658B, partial [Vibrio parahaemolyticus VPTS-2010_2]
RKKSVLKGIFDMRFSRW